MVNSKRNIGRVLAVCLLTMFNAQLHAEENDVLTDENVAAVLDSGSPGVFYAWSPHMPLSVDGLREMVIAGERLGLVVIPVLSSHANVAYARDRVDARELPETVLRQSESYELVSRNLFVHAPAILIFDGGEFVSPVLPGFRYASDYETLINRFLKEGEDKRNE